MQSDFLLDIRQICETSAQQLMEKLDPAKTKSKTNSHTSLNSVGDANDHLPGYGGAVCLATSVRRKCVGHCRCQCHRRNDLSTPQAFTRLFGQLCIRYASLPLIGESSCDYPPCQNHTKSSLQLNYLFPAWLLRRTLSVSTYWDFVSGISVHLSLPQVLPSKHHVWSLILWDNLSKMKQLITRREINPTVTLPNGDSMLLVNIKFT